ncbi:MAG: hypothetical protein EF807_01395 [Candidatus Methanolliviera hydrocarbonicum]|uniref:Uncharacterized protein n=1 Tax=Candidatus Methanolliviera hydrocarbonicum TaxID=2491085 RepID=A0A520KZH2_9EURY|nr:MAG: hypothetical protein EF807_01395 [Candidatus Methanolliviera hydrocarbonicum]
MFQTLSFLAGSLVTGIVFLLIFARLIRKEENIDALLISLFALFEGMAYLMITGGVTADYLGVGGMNAMVSFQQVSNLLGGIATLFLFLFSLSISTDRMKNPLITVAPTAVTVAYIFAICHLPWTLVPIEGTLVKAVSEQMVTVTLLTRLPLLLCVIGLFAYHLAKSPASYRKVRLSLSLLITGVSLFTLFTVVLEATGLLPGLAWLWYLVTALSAIIIYWGFDIPRRLLDRLPEF